ncbi:MAG: ribonuclease P protein subunit [Thaumarchaeota archaeon]|nr:ribonuclease P protein subunit [Nitrososphaerota archaeon]
MNTLVGERVKIVASSDPTQLGLKGEVVLESAGTFLVDSGKKTLRIQKKGTVFQLSGSREVVCGDEMPGRLEDRMARAVKR